MRTAEFTFRCVLREESGQCTQVTAYLIGHDTVEANPHPFTSNIALERTPWGNGYRQTAAHERGGAAQLYLLGVVKTPTVPTSEFFHLLYAETPFCAGVGRVMLAAAMLETNLRLYLRARSIAKVRGNATFGNLVSLLKAHRLLTRNGEMHFDDLVAKRNYLADSLYDLFTNVIEETILPRTQLVEEDVVLFTDRAEQLAEDFFHFSSLVAKADPKKAILL